MFLIPAGEIIGDKHRVRTVGLKNHTVFPDGDYTFVDMHCPRPDCDCRKTSIQIIYNQQQLIGTINYAWESDEYYKKWMGGAQLDTFTIKQGASVDITSPRAYNDKDILALFKMLLNEKWITMIKYHYQEVKAEAQRRALQPTKKSAPRRTSRPR